MRNLDELVRDVVTLTPDKSFNFQRNTLAGQFVIQDEYECKNFDISGIISLQRGYVREPY